LKLPPFPDTSELILLRNAPDEEVDLRKTAKDNRISHSRHPQNLFKNGG